MTVLEINPNHPYAQNNKNNAQHEYKKNNLSLYNKDPLYGEAKKKSWKSWFRREPISGTTTMFGSGSLSYYCMSCGTKHNQAACPKCGSKMKRVGS